MFLLAITPPGNKSATRKEKKEVREREIQRERARQKKCVLGARNLGLRLDPPPLAPAKLIAIAGVTFFSLALIVAGEASPSPDKGDYTLLNPTPDTALRELSADRPDKTDSLFTVDAGHFQLEMDFWNFSYHKLDSEGEHFVSREYQIAPMNVKVGLLNNVDLQLELAPWQWERTKNETSGAVETHAGFGDITPRFKINLLGNDEGFFALALIPSVTVPTAQDHPGNHAVGGGLGIPYALDVPGWDIGFQHSVAFNRDGNGRAYHSEVSNSVSVGHPVIGRLSYFVEFFSNVSAERGVGWLGTVDTWLTYGISRNVRLDGGVYLGVTPSADAWHPWIGMTWRY